MAIMSVDLFSKSLMRTVHIRAIIPGDQRDLMGNFVQEPKPLKTLYLLHGILGSESDWVNGTRIAEWAQSRNLAVIMPAGENRFYVDQQKTMEYYGEFIGQELVELTRRLFPLSHKKEDTYIAGLSMGGYGALRNGLKYHETFGAIGALSSALVMDDIAKSDDTSPISFQRRSYYEAVFGDVHQVVGSDLDPRALIQQLKKTNQNIPKLYLACGLQDFLIEKNHVFRDFLIKEEVEVTYEEGEGTHSWLFWDTYMKHFLDWLALDSEAAVHSGNVR